MLKYRLIIIFTFLMFAKTYGQVHYDGGLKKARNTLYIELLGNAGYLYNITYDRVVYTKEKNNISTGIGAQYFPSSDFASDNIYSISPQINYFYGIKHHFETGLGVAYDFNSGDLVIPIRIGYRYQKPNGGVFGKIGFTPLLTKSYPILGEGFTLIAWGGLACGYSF